MGMWKMCIHFAFSHHGYPLIKLHIVDCYDSFVLIMLSLNVDLLLEL